MIILSVPYTAKDNPDVNSISKRVDFTEYRLDYEKSLATLEVSSFTSQDIVTIRDTSEGGINHFAREIKLEMYKNVLQTSEALVDDEILHYTDILPTLEPDRLILSWHAFNLENSYVILPEIISLSNRLACKYLKIAVAVDSYSQLLILHDEIARSNKPVILAGLGKLGKLARLLFRHLGAIGTYVGIAGNETAPGQLTYEESCKYNLNDMTPEHLIGGVIGGEQVWHSHGTTHYIKVFYEHNYSAHYLPFEVFDWDDFWKWLMEASEYITFFGFSITMPWKSQIAKSIGSDSKMLNTYLPARFVKKIKPWEDNTDQIAFIRSLAYLKVARTASVLIYGTGAMAEMVLGDLSEYPNISLFGRNEKRQKELSDVFHVPILSKNALKATKWSLLINCTPIGMIIGSDHSSFHDIQFESVIDLPYAKGETELTKFCRKKGIPVVPGDMFWLWQAEKQEEHFKNEIERLISLC